MNESLIAVCQLFLVPLTILFAAVGVANARFVKLLVCLLGVGLAGLWLYRIYLWTGLSLIDRRTGYGLAGSFALCWVPTLLHQIKSSFGGDAVLGSAGRIPCSRNTFYTQSICRYSICYTFCISFKCI